MNDQQQEKPAVATNDQGEYQHPLLPSNSIRVLLVCGDFVPDTDPNDVLADVTQDVVGTFRLDFGEAPLGNIVGPLLGQYIWPKLLEMADAHYKLMDERAATEAETKIVLPPGS